MRALIPIMTALGILAPLTACAPAPAAMDDLRTVFDPEGRNPGEFVANSPQATGQQSAVKAVSGTGPLSPLRLGLVDGDNKRATMAVLDARSRMFDPTGAFNIDNNPQQIPADLDRALNARFKSASPADSTEQSFSRGDDVALTFDLVVNHGTISGMSTTVSITGTFQARDGTMIGKINGLGQYTIPYPATSVFRAAWMAALADFMRKLDREAPQIASLSARRGPPATTTASRGKKAVAAVAPPPPPAQASPPPQPVLRFATTPPVARFPRGSERPDDVAVIIGNADYSRLGKDIPDVKPAHADAEGARLYATQALGIKDGNIIVLKDATGSQMTRVFGSKDNPQGQLFDWVKPGRSRVYVYYSGHGAPGGQGGSPYLIPTDADAARIELNGYPVKQLYDNLGKLPAASVTVVLEACFSGISPAGSVLSSASPVFFDVKAPPVPGNLTVITAGAANQMASWETDGTSSLFTKYYLKAMAGEADADRDGRVSLDELERYLKDTLSYYARRHYGRDQQAQIVKGGGR